MHSFTQDLTCVTYLLLSETMHLLQVSRAEADDAKRFKIISQTHPHTHICLCIYIYIYICVYIYIYTRAYGGKVVWRVQSFKQSSHGFGFICHPTSLVGYDGLRMMVY